MFLIFGCCRASFAVAALTMYIALPHCLLQGFAAVGALGITILVSSGDSGAHGRTDGACTSKKTVPDWPASSPYILSVGATQVREHPKYLHLSGRRVGAFCFTCGGVCVAISSI